ncbi:MAG: hypothetical protein ACUZ8O_05885 [Candidatus Anammoxibacter sp.]
MYPFTYNQPVKGEDFYNREEVVKDILKETALGKTQGNVWITGERQVGKTSLLQHIQLSYADYKERIKLYGTGQEYKIAFIFANVQGYHTETAFYNALEDGIRNYFDYKLPNSENYFQDVVKYLYKEQNIFTIFLVDEFDAFIQNVAAISKKDAEQFLTNLASTLQGVSWLNNAKPFSFVFTSNNTIHELMEMCELKPRGSGLIIESKELMWFTKDQVTELAKHCLKDNEYCFDTDAINFCYKNAQGYPYFTQKLFSIMYDLRDKYDNKKKFLKEVKLLYGKEFAFTVKGWGGERMPKRTLNEIVKLAGNSDIRKFLFDTGMTIFKSMH